jgi:SAM-dependent methyltransferase
MQRREVILGDVNPAKQRGLEIGPLGKPIVTRDDGEIWYADYMDAAALKEYYEARAELFKGHDPDLFTDVDFVLGEVPLAEAAADVAPFDYVVASHVVEHVPNLVGWLREMSSVLRPAGTLCLAVPDCRYTFDALRSQADLADVIAAHLDEDSRPSPRAFFDFNANFARRDGQDAGAVSAPLKPGNDLRQVYAWTEAYAQSSEHVDVHVWPLTASGLASIVDGLAELQLTDFRISSLEPTVPGDQEFFCRLVKRSVDDPQRWGQKDDGDDLRLATIRAERDALAHQLAELRASTSWRATRPLRAISSALRSMRPLR